MPGLASHVKPDALDASAQRDYPLIIAILLTTSLVVVAANVVTDVVYTAFDPRVEV